MERDQWTVLLEGLKTADDARAMIYDLGVCPQCRQVLSHWVTEPFASCACGTTEDTSGPGLIPQLFAKIAGLPEPEHTTIQPPDDNG